MKKNIKLFSVIFIASLLSMTLFLQPHFVHDTYNFYANDFKPMTDYLGQGRLITYCLTCFLSNFNGISHYIIQFLSVVLAIVYLSISSCILYRMIEKRIQIKKDYQKLLILVISQMTFFTLYILEWFMFFEVSIMCMGVLFSVIAAYQLIENNKYLYATIFYILSVFSYQASIAIGGVLVVLFYLYDNKNNKLVKNIKNLIIMFIPYIIALLSNYIYMKMGINGADSRTGSPDLMYNFIFIIKQSFYYIIKAFNFYPMFYIPIIVILILYLIIKLNKDLNINILYILMTMFSLWFLSILPILVMNSNIIYIIPRSIPYISAIMSLGFIMIILYYNEECFKNKLFISLVVITFIVSLFQSINIQSESLKNSTKDIQIVNIILDEIEKYENENNIEVNKIKYITSENVKLSHKGMIQYGDISLRALVNNWSAAAIFNYVTDRKFEISNATKKEKENKFLDYEADDFSLDQLLFENDTLYLFSY